MSVRILGISAFYHDSAAALLCDGELIAAAQEERFSRRKHDARFPARAVTCCLDEAGITLRDVDEVVFYDKPFVKFERLLETYLANVPRGFASFARSMPVWVDEKLFLSSRIRKELARLGDLELGELPKLLFSEHHEAHAASAFFPSPFQRAAVLAMDGVGEWATTSTWLGDGASLQPLWEIDFPHSLGLLYSAFTYYCGFKVNSGEYKLMGLAPYGEPRYVDLILEHLIDVKDDGTHRLDMAYFDFATGLEMTSRKFADLFGGPPRAPESQLTRKHMDLARSVQVVTGRIVISLARTLRRETDMRHLCLAGGVALNCVANGELLRERIFDDIWIQPAAGDAGGSVGAAYVAWHRYHGAPRRADGARDSTRGSFLGDRHAMHDVRRYLDGIGAPFEELPDADLLPRVARLIADGKVVGWFQGRMEFGPRALGGRSILGDPRNAGMQSVMNLKIKHRESFRPFAPAIKAERVAEWFDLDRPSPYMLLVAQVRADRRLPETAEQKEAFGIERLKQARSTIPAVTHVDASARVQTVHRETNPRFHALLDAFEELTGCPLLINTSFNVRGEPIVGSPEDAYRCFMRTEMDHLVIENALLARESQPERPRDDSWMREIELD